MTAPRFRRHRSSDGRRPAFAGDFTDDGRDITEVIADYDGSTYEWGGASNVGLPDGALFQRPPYPPYPYQTRPPGPDMFPALHSRPGDPLPPIPPHTYDPDSHQHGRPCTFCGEGPDHPLHTAGTPDPPPPPPPAQHEPRDTGPQQRLPRYSRTAARPRPQRAPDCAIFVWVPSISQHVLLCGMCLWRRHADPITASMPFTFESLRQSAYVTGWRTDAFTRWCCPHCQGTAAYHSPRQVIQWDGDALDAYLAGDVHAESWHRARAERHLICDVADASHGKHAAVTR